VATKTLVKRMKLSTGNDEILPVPDLISLQRDSWNQFLAQGILEELLAISPIVGNGGRHQLEFLADGFEVRKPEKSLEDCRLTESTYSFPLRVKTRLIDRETGEVKEQEVYMGEIPMMTDTGTFLINGVERIIVSQFVRSPGVYFKGKLDKKKGKNNIMATVIPNRGAWLEIECDSNHIVYAHINKMKKIPVTTFMGAIGYTNEELLNLIEDKDFFRKTLEKAPITSPKECLLETYKKLRPGDPLTIEGAKLLLNNLFFDTKTYDLGRVGRYKINRKLSVNVPEERSVVQREDIIAIINYVVSLAKGQGFFDDIDHLGNRRIRTVGELVQKQFRVGLARLERLIREQMTINSNETIVPQILINIRPLMAVMKEFFGSSQLSQFMDQTNPLSELAHKRRLSALGPGGLTRERAGFEVRDIHPSHYGRICPIETPEGPNAGLISPLATYARVNKFGFIETPYRKVQDGKLTDKVEYLAADIEDRFRIAPFDVKFKNDRFVDEKVPVRYVGKFLFSKPEEVDYVCVSARQVVGVTSSLIPFLEHDDANRALMGSNMQRQATPPLQPERPFVGTGMEREVVKNAGVLVVAKSTGVVEFVSADKVLIKPEKGPVEEYKLVKYRRSNQDTCINQKPIVHVGDKVKPGDVLADGSATQFGELAVGRNISVAFMPFEGYNFEDAIVISDRLVKQDEFSSIHINKFELEVRTTKLGAEEITREIPNVSEEALKNLDESGIVMLGAEVFPGDVLVGKVTPKGETEPPAEEKLLRAIFGDKARDMRDTSLRCGAGEYGKVIDVRIFTREKNDELPPGVNQIVRVYVAQLRKIMIGDKMAGRHGNKGVISMILPECDMPMLPDGTPLDIVLNPLGVPSRMNVGQIFETVLGTAGKALNEYYELHPFDETNDPEASVHVIQDKLKECKKVKNFEWVDISGQTVVRDGKTGEPFDQKVTVGWIYMLKLIHLVEDKIHARSTGPYSLVTQQPLGGKAQFGGQRFGEMEVWALEAYGAAYTLQELLTVKSDDVSGRARAYESIIKGKPMAQPGTPESFRVLVRELRSIGLDVRILNPEGAEIDAR